MGSHSRFSVGALALMSLLGLNFLASPARADEQESQQYLHWAKFKPGSTATLAGEIDSNGTKVQIDLINTLVQVTPEKIVLESYSVVHFAGHEQKNPAHKRDVPAKEEKKNEIKQLPDEEVEAAGKKFKCKVFEGTDIASAPSTKAKAKVWVSDVVPGGAVKMMVTGEKGTTTIFTLKSFDAK